MRLLAPVVLLAAAALLYVEADLQVRLNAQAATDTQRDFSTAALTAPPTSRWPTNGGNLYNQRYSPLEAINRDNVARLKGVWRARLRGYEPGAYRRGASVGSAACAR